MMSKALLPTVVEGAKHSPSSQHIASHMVQAKLNDVPVYSQVEQKEIPCPVRPLGQLKDLRSPMLPLGHQGLTEQ